VARLSRVRRPKLEQVSNDRGRYAVIDRGLRCRIEKTAIIFQRPSGGAPYIEALKSLAWCHAWKIRKTGRAVASDWVHVFTIRDSKIVAFREFTDTAQFAEAYRG
jgi:hypothetical protein